MNESFQKVARKLSSADLVNTLVLMAPSTLDMGPLSQLVPALSDKGARGGETTLYICENFTCRPAIVSVDAIIDAIDSLKSK
jgi:uncharacterized protein YyaL (SSP411 family)